jgi:hypothetical protein
MRDYLRTTGAKVVAALGVLGIVVTILGWAIPTLRDWLGAHPGLGWTIAAVAAVGTSALYLVDDSTIRDLKLDREALAAERDDLRSRLHPTPHDLDFFEKVIRYFPWDQGVMGWLDAAFTGKIWRRSNSEPLYLFNDGWTHTFFDDETVQQAYEQFREATHALGNWLATEGAPNDSLGGEETVYTILEAERRSGGWPDFSATRNEGLELARDVLSQRREFERVGRQRGLRVPIIFSGTGSDRGDTRPANQRRG